jgi:hypothetical protein
MSTLEVAAVWANDDAESSIKISRSCWEKILLGASYEQSAWAWYEGKRFSVMWEFGNKAISISGSDCAQYLVDEPVEQLIVTVSDS